MNVTLRTASAILLAPVLPLLRLAPRNIRLHAARTLLLTGALCALLGGPARAVPPAPQDDVVATEGFRVEMALEIKRFRERALEFVGEIPEDKLSWRANPEAFSLGELTARLSAAGYRSLQSLEREVEVEPEELARHSDRATLLADLEAMTDAVLRALEEIPDEDLGLPIDHLGRRWTVRGIFLLLDSQLHEGLGLLSGFAEAGGIDPPWVRQRKAEALTDD